MRAVDGTLRVLGRVSPSRDGTGTVSLRRPLLVHSFSCAAVGFRRICLGCSSCNPCTLLLTSPLTIHTCMPPVSSTMHGSLSRGDGIPAHLLRFSAFKRDSFRGGLLLPYLLRRHIRMPPSSLCLFWATRTHHSRTFSAAITTPQHSVVRPDSAVHGLYICGMVLVPSRP